MEERTHNFTIFLMKEYVSTWHDCIKSGADIKLNGIKDHFNICGILFVQRYAKVKQM